MDISIRGFEGRISPDAIKDLVENYRDVLKAFNVAREEFDRHPMFEELMHSLRRMDGPLRYISREMGLRLPRDPGV